MNIKDWADKFAVGIQEWIESVEDMFDVELEEEPEKLNSDCCLETYSEAYRAGRKDREAEVIEVIKKQGVIADVDAVIKEIAGKGQSASLTWSQINDLELSAAMAEQQRIIKLLEEQKKIYASPKYSTTGGFIEQFVLDGAIALIRGEQK